MDLPEDAAVERDEAAEAEVEHEPAQPVPGQGAGDLAEAFLPRRRAERDRWEGGAHEALWLWTRSAGLAVSHPPMKPARSRPVRT